MTMVLAVTEYARSVDRLQEVVGFGRLSVELLDVPVVSVSSSQHR